MTSITTALPLTSTITSLEAYLKSIREIPFLTAEEERALATQWHTRQDVHAAKQLVLSHLRYVVSIAKNYLGYGLPLADLVQEGNIGLMKAVKKFDPNVGVKLVSFAVHWIKAEIHEYILRNWRIVKIATTKAQRRLFFKLKSFKQKFGENIGLIAKEMGIKKSTVEQMDARLNVSDADISDFQEIPDDKYTDPAKLIEYQDKHQDKEKLLHALSLLDDRSKEILYSRFLSEKKMTLTELSKKYNVSFQRICQIEKSAMEKLKVALISS
jgi:RNA polymerase sigma-32 factor